MAPTTTTKAAPKKKMSRREVPKKSQSDLSFVGRRVARKFSGKLYYGVVDKLDAKHRLWHVIYDDGDEEDFDYGELSFAVDLADGKIKPTKKKKKAENKKVQERKTAGYRVVSKAYPSSGSGTYEEKRTVGEFDTEAEAHEAALAEMDRTCQFEDWGREHYEGQPPPYSSAEGPFEAIADEDEYVDIYVVDIGKKVAAKKRELDMAKASKPPPKKKAKAPTTTTANASAAAAAAAVTIKPSTRKFGETKQSIQVDGSIFARNPCRIAGGTTHPPSAYPNYSKGTGSFGFLIQRLSDRNYAMRAYCCDGAGAEYTSFKKSNIITRCIVWMPLTNLNDHGTDETIVDGCHLDLIDPKDGKMQLTAKHLQCAVDKAKGKIECLFLNGAQTCDRSGVQSTKAFEADDIARAIETSRDTLKCLSLTECIVNGNVLRAIASCTKLRGIILENLQLRGGDATDAKLASVFRSCNDLSWAFISSSIFSTECWNVLAAPSNACPELEVLWADATMHTDDRIHIARGDHDTIRSALNSRSDRLKLCMINPDEKVKSRFVIGGTKKTDRLNGKVRPPMPTFW